MTYFEAIQEAYGLVRNGDTSHASVQKALQYENWQHLPDEITERILAHPNYSLLDAGSGERPVPNRSEVVQACQIPRDNKTINLAYSLKRFRDDSQFDIIDADDFPQLWEKLEKDQKRGMWMTIDRLTLQSERDLHHLVCRLGLYHWRGIPLQTPVFCLELHNIDCVKPNALDAGLTFYFHQTPGQEPGRTRNLETSEPDMEEWLCLEEVNRDKMKCVGGCFIRQKVEANVDDYYKNNAQRIHGENEYG